MAIDPKPLELRIPTASLRSILDESGTLAKLESFACEKIAEEIARKAPGRVEDAVAKVEARAVAIINKKLSELGSRYGMPRVVLDSIAIVARESIKPAADDAAAKLDRDRLAFTKRMHDDLTREIAKLFQDAEIKAEAQHKKRLAEIEATTAGLRELFDRDLRQLVRDEARLSFIDVLRDVKNETLGIF